MVASPVSSLVWGCNVMLMYMYFLLLSTIVWLSRAHFCFNAGSVVQTVTANQTDVKRGDVSEEKSSIILMRLARVVASHRVKAPSYGNKEKVMDIVKGHISN